MTAYGPDDAPITFEYLAKHRKLLREFCRFHVPSLAPFEAKEHAVFAVTLDNKPTGLRHITSTSTCFSSLDLCPDEIGHGKKSQFHDLGKKFAESAIGADLDQWRSDKAAVVYCSCRGLPYVLSRLDGWVPKIDEHLHRIIYQLQQPTEVQKRFAIGEAAPPVGTESPEEARKGWYPPNAYHTYWALEILRLLRSDKFSKGREASENYSALSGAEGQMRLWARQQLGVQIALHVGESSKLDSDQLAWSLAILLCEPATYESDLIEQDLIRQAFKCLFGTQEPIGTWRHYGPLFHYPHVGNAYCYVFETFAVLLEQALKPKADFLRIVLKEHASHLIRLWQYADATKAEIHDSANVSLGRGFGWTSGHTVMRRVESWATASVFAYSQTLRMLVGIWARDGALSTLNHKVALRTKDAALLDLHRRARTWTHPDLPDLLASMFINPMVQTPAVETIDPDRPLIGRDSSRSAILFGPPGTGKTFLISAVAEAIGWKYVELHPSHFVSEGLPDVQRTADGIFSKLMELDHVVILFDEIDELVREREIEPDQFGRFLTTSMLPRLAELWKARKVIYFVATNHIEYFDRAVTRSERFDAIIFLSPPSFESKCSQILNLLKEKYAIIAEFGDDVSEASVFAALPKASCDKAEKIKDGDKRKEAKAAPPPLSSAMSKFALIRWDELDGVALQLSRRLGDYSTITAKILSESLRLLKDGKNRGLGEYCRFLSDPDGYERFDASKNASWVVTDIEGRGLKLEELPAPLKRVGDGTVIVEAAIGNYRNVNVIGFASEPAQSNDAKPLLGAIRLRKLQATV